jgi:hypothetical protein
MASSSQPKIVALLAGAAIAKGKAVKKGSTDSYVIAGTANTSRCIGVCQNAPAAADDVAEIALNGGGGKGLLGETVAMGDLLVSHTDGSLVKANASGDHVIAMAMKDGVANDLIDIEVMISQAAAAE